MKGLKYSVSMPILAFLVIFFIMPLLTQAAWYNSSWKYRKTITIDNTKVEATVSNFPVLINMTDTDLRDNAQSDGDDILFTSSDGTTKLSHEIETYTSGTGELIAWVKIPSLSSSSDTIIYMYYGNSGASSQQDAINVWDSSFKMVQHLNEDPGDPSPEFKDSTSNDNDGSDNSTSSTTGKIGNGIYFDGSYDWIQVPHSASLVISGDQFTFSAWIKSTVNQNDDCGIIIKSDGSNYNMQLGVQGSDQPNFRVRSSGSTTYLTGSTVIPQNTWYYLYGIYNGFTMKVYLNTSEDATANRTGNVNSPAQDLVMGRRTIGDNRFFQGDIDEARVAYTARSTGWMNTEYNNQNSPGTFYSVGDETPIIQFTATSSNGAESVTPADLELSLSGAVGQDVTVDYAVTGGTATGSGTDYTLASGTATITSGNTTTNISPTIVDDTMFELDETIIVTISNPGNGVLGSNTEFTYTITDNDAAPSIQFSSTSSNGSEATTPVNLELSLSNTAYQNVTVDYAVTSGTATGSGTDYTLASGTATITTGNTTTDISATIVDDTLDEANETIIVTISDPSNASLGTNTTHTYTINDNDDTPTIHFTSTSSSGGEATTPANLELSLSAAAGQNVTVDYALSGTATGGGVDYTLASGTATITAGNTTTNISATIVDDSVGEANETIIVTISSPSNATLGDNTAYTYTINDNDPSKLSINQQPSNSTAGSTISPALTVQILDVNDTLVTSATDNVTIAIANNAGSGTLSGTLTKAASSGVATFSDLSINNVGTGYTLTVTSGSLTAATSDAFNITSASAGYFKVTGTASKTAGSTNELTITAYDQYGNVATGYTGSKSLTFSGPSNAPSGTVPTVEGTDIGSGTSVNFTSGVSDSGAATLTAYKAETTTVDATDGSLHSFTETSYDLDLTVIAGSAATLEIVSGDEQAGIVGGALSNFFVVNVTDTYGNAVSGETVTWAITTTPTGASGESLSSETTATDSNGEAQSQLTLGTMAGTYQVQVSASSIGDSPVTFSATGNSSAAQDITLVSGSCQSGIVSTALASPFVVKVTDSQGNAVSGVSIGWSITTVPYGSSGSVLSSETTETDSDGEASSTLTLGDKPGLYKVEASVSGLTGSPVTFTATNGTTVFIKGGSYHKISLPYQFDNGNAESVLNQLGAYNPAKWRLYRYVNGAYLEYPNVPDFAPGLAYWLISANDETLVISGTAVSSNATVTLEPGWNQIGNPFKCSVTWDAIKAANAALFDNNIVADILWGYSTEYLEFVAAAALDSWQGFWVYNASGSNVDLVIPYQ